MIPNCDLSRENLSAGFSTRSDTNQHVKQTLEISYLESREILISKNKGLCNELILVFYLPHFTFSRPHSDFRALMGRGTRREVKGAPRPLVGPGQKSGRGFP